MRWGGGVQFCSLFLSPAPWFAMPVLTRSMYQSASGYIKERLTNTVHLYAGMCVSVILRDYTFSRDKNEYVLNVLKNMGITKITVTGSIFIFRKGYFHCDFLMELELSQLKEPFLLYCIVKFLLCEWLVLLNNLWLQIFVSFSTWWTIYF